MSEGLTTSSGPGSNGATAQLDVRQSAAFAPGDPAEGPAPAHRAAGAPDDWQHRAWTALRRAPGRALPVALIVAVVLGVFGALAESGGKTVYTSRTVMLIDDPYRLATSGDDGVLLNLSALRIKYSALIGTQAIAGPVARKLGLPMGEVLSSVSGQVPAASLLMDVDATTSSARLAERLSAATAAQVNTYVRNEDFDFGIPKADQFTFNVIDPASPAAAQSPSHAKAATVGLALAIIGFLLAFGAIQLYRNRDLLG